MAGFVSPSEIRARFCRAMSAMYRSEVPLYGELVDLVVAVNAATLAADPELAGRLKALDNLERISEERHGAIRLGKAEELFTIRRLFAVMGMEPVGYYDLAGAGIPVHSTAFRPVDEAALKISSFRVFTSLLRLELIADPDLRETARQVLARRDIFSVRLRALLDKAEAEGGLSDPDCTTFIAEAIETFRWHADATVPAELYAKLAAAHRLIADVVSFRGPHINHLTPRTLDIDRVQALMPGRGITPKAVIEGPPPRRCPILLRQTSFKALNEPVAFATGSGERVAGAHTARFGEIEQRGVALTRKGRALYDRLLDRVRDRINPAADGANAAEYQRVLSEVFAEIPDSEAELREQGLAYFHYSLTAKGEAAGATSGDLDALIGAGLVQFDPVVYEDFLPVSAAGIFQSNLGDDARQEEVEASNRALFETALGTRVADEFALYEAAERGSIEAVLAALSARGD